MEGDGSTQTILVMRTERRGAQCPSCKQHSDAPHSTYVLRPADLPSAGRAVQLEPHVRRFSCHNARCKRRTFAGHLPRLLAPSARRTRRLARAQCAVSMTAGAKTGARLLNPLAMPTTPDTLLRLMHHTPLPVQTPPQRVPGPSILAPYLKYLAQRHADGCDNALALWREIRAKGFEGTSRQVHRWLQTRRTTVARSPPAHVAAMTRARTSRAPVERSPHPSNWRGCAFNRRTPLPPRKWPRWHALSRARGQRAS